MTKTFACMSDIHGLYEKIAFPEADFLLVCGDILQNYVPYGENIQLEIAHQQVELEKFGSFLRGLNQYKHKLIVFGNHDWVSEMHDDLTIQNLLGDGITYLRDRSVTIDGLKFWGSPWVTHPSRRWAWCFPNHRKDPERAALVSKACWDQIPIDTDILLTHSPPFQVLDHCFGGNVGCQALRNRLDQLENLKLHVFGHIHPSSGVRIMRYEKNNSIAVNASICDDMQQPINPIKVISLEL